MKSDEMQVMFYIKKVYEFCDRHSDDCKHCIFNEAYEHPERAPRCKLANGAPTINFDVRRLINEKQNRHN